MRKAWIWALGIALGLAIAAGLTCQEKWPWIRPFGGAFLVAFAPATLGFLFGFLVGFEPNGKEKTVLSKFIDIGLGFIAGASVVSFGQCVGLLLKHVPGIAKDLYLTPAVLVFLFPTFFVPAFILGYLWKSDQLDKIVRLAKTLQGLLEPEGMTEFVLGKSPRHNKVLKEYDSREDELVMKYKLSPLIPAMNFYRKKEYDNVLKTLDGKVGAEVDRGMANLLIGASMMHKGQVQEAINYLKQVKDDERFKPGIDQLLGQAYKKAGELIAAKRHNSVYLGARESDMDVAKDQLDILKRIFQNEQDDERRTDLLRDAKHLAENMIGKYGVKKEKVKEIWQDIILEDENGN